MDILQLIQLEHAMRKDRCETLPLVPKKRKRPRPNTALISEAAKMAYERRNNAADKKY